MPKFSKTTIRVFIFAFKFLIFLAAIYVIKEKLSHISMIDVSLFFREIIFHEKGILVLLVVGLMVYINWDLETRKWQLLMKKFQKLNYLNSFKAVLAGSAVSFVSPNRSGSFVGRILFLREKNRAQGTAMSIVGGFAQTLVSLITGLFTLSLFFFPNNLLEHKFIIIIAGTLSALIFLLLYFRTDQLSKIRSNKKVIKDILKAFADISNEVRWKVFAMSALRYFVFSIQFALLIWLTGIPISLTQILACVFIIYFIMGLLPSLWLGNLGPRELISIMVISSFLSSDLDPINELIIIIPSLLLWFMNLCIPALIGYTVLLFQKIRA